MDDALRITGSVLTAALAVIGLYLARSYRRQLALRVAERRLAAHADLWRRMEVATPVRIAKWNI